MFANATFGSSSAIPSLSQILPPTIIGCTGEDELSVDVLDSDDDDASFLNPNKTSQSQLVPADQNLPNSTGKRKLYYSSQEYIDALTKGYRIYLPGTMYDQNEIPVWHVLKQCIGKDLSRMSFPVIFNEPLSLLERLCEFTESFYLIEHAAAAKDSMERLKWISAFVVSCCSSSGERLRKPFNPLLGETYQLCRPELGDFKLVAEQVSHHPPVSAFHTKFNELNASFHGTVYPKAKFTKSFEIAILGDRILEFPAKDSGKKSEVITWTDIHRVIHNIIVGKMWLEQCGNMVIRNWTTGETVELDFKESSFFGKNLNIVEGFILDKFNARRWFLFGKWNEAFYCVPIEVYQKVLQISKLKPHKSGKGSQNYVNGVSPLPESSTSTRRSFGKSLHKVLATHRSCKELWSVAPRPAYCASYYNQTKLSMTLNQLPIEEEIAASLPITDSRFRPDIRALEEGNISLAELEKNRLEEKQRDTEQKRLSGVLPEWKPLWFKPTINPHTKNQNWTFTNNYWKREFSACPNFY